MIPAVLVTTLFCALQLALAMDQQPDEAAGAGHPAPSERNIPYRTRNRFRSLSNLQPANIHQAPSDVVRAYFPPSGAPTSGHSVQAQALRRGTARSRINLHSTTTNLAEGTDHTQSLAARIEGTSGSQGVRRPRQAIHQSRHDRVGQAAESRVQETLGPRHGRPDYLPYSTWEHPVLTHTAPPHGHHSESHTHIGFERQTRISNEHPSGEIHHWALTMSGNRDALHGESSAGPHAGHHTPESAPAGLHGESSSGIHRVHHPQQPNPDSAHMFPDFDQYQHILLDTARPAPAPPLDVHSQASSPAHTSTELPPLAPGTFRQFALNHYPSYDSTSPPSSPIYLPHPYKKPEPSINLTHREAKVLLRDATQELKIDAAQSHGSYWEK